VYAAGLVCVWIVGGIVGAVCEEGARVSREPGRTPRQVFGAMVRYHREKAGMTRSQVATGICKSVSLVEAIERGDRVATEDVTVDLDRVLGGAGDLTQLGEELGDGMSYHPFPAWFEDWVRDIEPRAKRLRSFQPNVVPGLLQTEDYARAVFSTRFGITDEEVEKRVASRLSRQEILARGGPLKFWAILDEWVLRRSAGGPHVMLEQVSKLVEAARQPHIVIRIVPASVGVHEGLYGGGFAIADLDGGAGIGQQEGAVHGGQPIREAEDLESLNLVWDTLRDKALPRSASLALLEEAAKSWSSAT
jgi:transcriptional regulator with XRE-family HTH domain